jgi:hypothetical protein
LIWWYNLQGTFNRFVVGGGDVPFTECEGDSTLTQCDMVFSDASVLNLLSPHSGGYGRYTLLLKGENPADSLIPPADGVNDLNSLEAECRFYTDAYLESYMWWMPGANTQVPLITGWLWSDETPFTGDVGKCKAWQISNSVRDAFKDFCVSWFFGVCIAGPNNPACPAAQTAIETALRESGFSETFAGSGIWVVDHSATESCAVNTNNDNWQGANVVLDYNTCEPRWKIIQLFENFRENSVFELNAGCNGGDGEAFYDTCVNEVKDYMAEQHSDWRYITENEQSCIRSG